MKITIESTTRIVEMRNRRNGDAVEGRIWEGKTESGIPVQCLIVRVATPAVESQEQFVAELKERRAPEQEQAFPLRMVL